MEVSDYPRATSKHIITINPAINPIVARSVFPPRWLSGTTSSTTMNIIAPAAKARAMTASQRSAAVSRKQTAERRTRKGKKPPVGGKRIS